MPLPTYIRSPGHGSAHYGLKVNSLCLPVFAQPVSSGCMCAKWLQPCPTLCNPMGCSPPGPSCPWDSPGKNVRVGCHALLQGVFPTRDQTGISCIGGRFFTTSATGKPELRILFIYLYY